MPNPLPYATQRRSRTYNRTLHWIAILTACATFPLIFMGGLVTSHQAGMSVPDWPNSYGYNMFLFPPRLWIGGIFYEHTHRLAGTAVGMLSILLVIQAWRVEQRRWVRRLAWGVLGAVIFQGVLGGLRVVWVNLDLAIVHGCIAQAFFCLTVLMASATSRWWVEYEPPAMAMDPDVLRSGRRVVTLAAVAASIIYLQLVIGAIMRHEQAGLAIPDLPLAYGGLIPPASAAALREANHLRTWQMDLPPVSLWQIWVHFAHRIGAVLVTVALTPLIVRILKHHRRAGLLARPAIYLMVLILTQLTLGVLVVLWRKPADITSYHVAVGALVLVTTFATGLRAMRLHPRTEAVTGEALGRPRNWRATGEGASPAAT